MAKGVKGSGPTGSDAPVRTSIVLRPSVWQKMKYISLMTGNDLSVEVDAGLNDYISKYEKKNGPIPLK